MKESEKVIVFTDGGSRNNPGPAAIGVVIKDVSGNIIKQYGEAIGIATNNEAEYRAVVSAFKKIKAMLGKEKCKKLEVEVNMDSELVVRQLTGKYKIENEKLSPFFLEIWNLKIDFGNIYFHHIPREQNKEADLMVNEALDKSPSAQLF